MTAIMMALVEVAHFCHAHVPLMDLHELIPTLLNS